MRPDRRIAAVAVLLLLPASAGGQQIGNLSAEVREYVSVPERVVALTGVRLIDGTGAAPSTDMTVVIRDGRIAEVGAARSVRIPDGARVMDLTGHTLIPGIVGLHDHTFYATAANRSVQLQYSAPRLYLGSGVTTIRTAGGAWTYHEINMKEGIDAGRTPGPRMHITSPYLDGPGDPSHATIETTDAARRFVEYWTAEGVTWFKAYTDVKPDVLGAAIEAAHRNGARFTGHLCSVSYREAVALGMDNLEHGYIANSDFIVERTPGRCPPNSYGQLATAPIDSATIVRVAAELAATGVPLTSTLSVIEGLISDRMQLDERARRALAPGVFAELEAVQQALASGSAGWSELLRRAQLFEYAFVQAGGILGAGVDPSGSGATLPGFGDLRNYELLLEAGFAPADAVRIMTLNGATILGIDDSLGTVQPGRIADLAVIRGDPVAQPADIDNVVLVFKDGVGYDAARLVRAVDGQVGIR
jgi:cytosine/adenosine deaminase-related metal-dependent hydrolase